jgi:hypothetical protein
MTNSKRIICGALAAMSLLALPAAGQAKSLTFGTRLDHEPSNSAPAHNCKEDGSDDPTPTCSRVAIDESIAVPGGLRAPADGRIVRFRVRAGAPGQVTFRLARLKNAGFNQALGEYTALGKSGGVGPTVNVAGRGFDETGNPVESFPANLKVKKGDYVGIDSTSTSALYCSSGGPNHLIFEQPLTGSFKQSTKTDGCELMVQAVMKPSKPKKKK